MGQKLTTDQAAKMLGIQPQAVRAAIRRGRLRATVFGKQFQITKEDVETYGRSRHSLDGK